MTLQDKLKVVELLHPAAGATYTCEITISERSSYISAAYFENEFKPFFRSSISNLANAVTWAGEIAAAAAKLAPKK